MTNELLSRLRWELPAVLEQAVADRRYLHMHPETGFETQNTERMVRERLTELGIEILPNKTGVIGRIPGRDHSRAVALRADMDALPILEENEVPYCSAVPGKMHACGHDGHTSMLLGAARLLQEHRGELPVDVLLLFQPSEELGPGGAMFMVEELKELGLIGQVEKGFALHLFNDHPVGTVLMKYGSSAASTDEFYITVHGYGGHAGLPHRCVDALSIGAKIVTAMESYMSRRMDPFDPAIFSVGVFEAGTAINIVAETAKVSGTIRCQKEETRAQILRDMERIVQSLCEGLGATCNIRIVHGLPVLLNNDGAVDYAMETARGLFPAERVRMAKEPMMGAEDFAYFAQAFPSAFIRIGSGNPDKGFTYLAHHPKFDFDEDAMETGILLLCGLALDMK